MQNYIGVTFVYDFSPEWIFKCGLKLPAWTDAKSYRLHLYDSLLEWAFKCLLKVPAQTNLQPFPSSNRFKNNRSHTQLSSLSASIKPTRSQMQHSFLPTWSFPTNAYSKSFVKSLIYPQKNAHNQEINSYMTS